MVYLQTAGQQGCKAAIIRVRKGTNGERNGFISYLAGFDERCRDDWSDQWMRHWRCIHDRISGGGSPTWRLWSSQGMGWCFPSILKQKKLWQILCSRRHAITRYCNGCQLMVEPTHWTEHKNRARMLATQWLYKVRKQVCGCKPYRKNNSVMFGSLKDNKLGLWCTRRR